ncbi:MAG: hypothetical protein H7335_11150 [Massilia sp.]|nr:hypothetical protein [Massilia sp.]
MNARLIMLLIVALLLPLAGYLAFKWFKVFNSKDGERYMKRRMQGPYVPLGADAVNDISDIKDNNDTKDNKALK